MHISRFLCRNNLTIAVVWCMEVSKKQMVCRLGDTRHTDGEGNGTPLQYSCLENSMDGGAWWAAVHGVARSSRRLSDFTFVFHFHALEKETATHSNVLAWRIPGTGSLVGCRSWGHTESDMTEVTQQQQQQQQVLNNQFCSYWFMTLVLKLIWLSDFTFTFYFHALEKEMATHSSVLAWRIPGTGSLVGCCLRGHTESDTTEVTAAAAAA